MIELISFILVWGVVFTSGVIAVAWLSFMAKGIIDEGDYTFACGIIAAVVMISVMLIALVIVLIGVLL